MRVGAGIATIGDLTEIAIDFSQGENGSGFGKFLFQLPQALIGGKYLGLLKKVEKISQPAKKVMTNTVDQLANSVQDKTFAEQKKPSASKINKAKKIELKSIR